MTKVIINDGSIRSLEFNDVYFSKEGGLDETKYVFLAGNNLEKRWGTADNLNFTIMELGFGTGLNYFTTRNMWESLPSPPNVTFSSVERYPLSDATLVQMKDVFHSLPTWEETILLIYAKCSKEYQINPDLNFKFTYDFAHPLAPRTFRLVLYFGDVLTHSNQWTAGIDALYLDGFSPAKNPDMWSETIFKKVKSLSKSGTTFATFTSAGFVKRNLEASGFIVSKQKGYGKKRKMLVGYVP